MLRHLATTVLLLANATGMLFATESANSPQVLGSCAVVKTTTINQHTQVELKVHLTNPGVQPVSVERLTFLTPGPASVAPLRTPIQLSAYGSEEISQQFKLPTRLYQSWQRGAPAFLIVEMRTSDGVRFHNKIRLNGKSPLPGE